MNLSIEATVSFWDELEKCASAASVAIGTGVGALAGLGAHRLVTRSERSQEKLLRDTGALPLAKFKQQQKAHRIAALVSALTGAGAGAATPFAYRKGMAEAGKVFKRVADPTVEGLEEAGERFSTQLADKIWTNPNIKPTLTPQEVVRAFKAELQPLGKQLDARQKALVTALTDAVEARGKAIGEQVAEGMKSTLPTPAGVQGVAKEKVHEIGTTVAKGLQSLRNRVRGA